MAATPGTPVAEDAPPSLSRLFLQGWEARRKIDACELASGSPERAVRERTYRLHASFTSYSFLCLRLCAYFIYGLTEVFGSGRGIAGADHGAGQ